MFQDLGEQRRRLTELYCAKSDEELLELDADSDNLTEVARQTLRDEMKTRRIAVPEREPGDVPRLATIGDHQRRPDSDLFERTPAAVRDDAQQSDVLVEYTWKTQLCECETPEQVWQLSEMLRSSGIDTWVQRPRGSFPRILVAADQLEEAQRIAAQPVPPDIVNESKLPPEVWEFDTPACPKCGADDPALESVEPSNTWRCDLCGNEWTELGDASFGSSR